MLSPEERQRIEAEERKRIAEERYRAEVRSKLESESSATVKSFSRLPGIIGIGAVLIVGATLYSNRSNRPKTDDDAAPAAAQAALKPVPVPKTRYIPESQKLATGQIIVKANGYVQYRLNITSEMVEPAITGTFNAAGGGGNDIQAVIADEMNYTNWINGHQARFFWETEGRQTTGSISARLAPGMYYLVFSNKFSVFTDKQVFLDVNLNYKNAETYYE